LRLAAVDLGASRLRVGIFDDGRLVRYREVETPRSGGREVIAEAIISLIRSLAESRVEGVGIASIGPLDLESGWVINTPNNPLRSFPLRDPIARALDTEVVVANDCVASVWGEYILGSGRGLTDLGYVTISTGIGGGFIVGGRLLVGRRGNPHEVGHIVVEASSESRCGCGGLGHWEAIASGSSIPRTALRLAREWRGPRTRALEESLEGSITAKTLYSHARSGDPFALRVVDYLNRINAAGLASIIASYDPEAIFIGGSVYINNRDLFHPGIEEYLRQYSLFEPPPIREATFGDKEALYGALAIILDTPPELARFL